MIELTLDLFIIHGCFIDGLWWIRVFGYGVRWKNVNKHRLMFSEREMKRGYKVGNWHFRILKPNSQNG